MSVLVLCLAVLASCSNKKNDGHSHDGEPWIADNFGHYQMCEKENKKVNEGEHTTNEEHICTVCGARVIARSPKNLEITVFNEFGFEKAITIYYDSNVVYHAETKFEKSGDSYSGYKIYSGENLVEEGKFASVDKDGYVLSQKTQYYENGEYYIYLYNEYGDCATQTDYDKDGNSLNVLKFENVYSQNGVLVQRKTYDNDFLSEDSIYEETSDQKSRIKSETYYFHDGTKEVKSFNEKELATLSTLYSADGDILEEKTYKYTYDKDGNVIIIKEYSGSSLVREAICSYTTYKHANNATYISQDTVYYSEGKHVYLYDENNDYVSITEYDANGEMTRISEIEYTYDDLGNRISEKNFVNGDLAYAIEYSCFANDPRHTYISKRTHYDNGYKYVTFYNEIGNVTKEIYYDQDGEVSYECTHEYTFDDRGNMLSEKEYEDGTLRREYEYSYSTSDPDRTYMSKRTDYLNGSPNRVEIYNENRETISEIEYDADGKVIHTHTFEYEYDDNGKLLKRHEYENGRLIETRENVYYPDGSGETYFSKNIMYYEDGSYRVIVYNTHGSIVSDTHYFADSTRLENTYDDNGNDLSETYYDADGNISAKFTYEYTYDNKGNIVLRKEYKNDTLYSETEYSYKTDDPEDVYASQKTYYYDNLSKEVIKYDECGATISEVVYDAQGNVEFSATYENEYDDEGNFLNEKKYENGVLTCLREYSYYTNGYSGTYTSKRTEYFENGSSLVTVYSENGEIISETHYDKDGNVIE